MIIIVQVGHLSLVHFFSAWSIFFPVVFFFHLDIIICGSVNDCFVWSFVFFFISLNINTSATIYGSQLCWKQKETEKNLIIMKQKFYQYTFLPLDRFLPLENHHHHYYYCEYNQSKLVATTFTLALVIIFFLCICP